MRASWVIACVCVPGLALAEPEVSFELRPHQPVPQLVTTVRAAPHVPASSLALAVSGRDPLVVRASEVRDFATAGEPVALALVLNGQEIWIGNDDCEADEDMRYVGVLKGLERGIDRLAIPASLPSGSEVSVVTYATGARYLMRDAPAAHLTGSVLGTQMDYRGMIGTDMVQGIELALSGLEHRNAAHKALIILGDGNDTNNELAKAQLVDLKKRAAQQGIETFAIVYKSALSSEGNVIATMVPGAMTVNSIDGIEAALSQVVTRVTDRYYVTFDATAFPADGQPHDYTLLISGVAVADETLTLPAHAAATPWWRWRWLDELALGVALVGGLALLWRWRVLAPSKPTA